MRLTEDLCEAYGRFVRGLRRFFSRLTEIFLKAYGEKLGDLRRKVSIRREILLEQSRDLTMFIESGFGNKIEYFYFKVRRTMRI